MEFQVRRQGRILARTPLEPSALLQRYLVLISLIAVMAVLYTAIYFPQVWLLIPFIVLAYRRLSSKNVMQVNKLDVEILIIDGGLWRVEFDTGEAQELKLLSHKSFSCPGLVILAFEGGRNFLVIARDSLSSDAFRHLRIALNWQ